jgi:hypothetical protein
VSGLAARADFNGLIGRLTAMAVRLGTARARAGALARSHPDRVWRSAALLWPLFTTGGE